MCQFMQTIQFLFDGRQALNVPGFAKHIVDVLNSDVQLPVFIGSGLRDVMGPVSSSDIDWCFVRMSLWCRLAKEVVQAECPDFALFAAFSVFDISAARNLPNRPSISSNLQRSAGSCHVERLAKAFNVDCAQLMAELARHKPLAEEAVRSTGCHSREAWQQALKQTQRLSRAREVFPAKALRPVLERYFAWTSSSSGVEQSFSKAKGSALDKTPACADTEQMLLKPLLDPVPAAEQKALVSRAQELYCMLHPAGSRDHAVHRLDKGLRRKAAVTGKASEASWLRARREGIAQAMADEASAAQAAESEAATKALAAAAWTESHEDEARFQQKKAQKRKLEALEDKLLLEHEVDDELREAAQQHARRTLQLDSANRRNARRKAAKAERHGRPLQWEPLGGKAAWVDPKGIDPQRTASIQNALAARGLTLASERAGAEVFFVENPAKRGERVRRLAGLRGGMIIAADQVDKGKGAFIKFKKGVLVRRYVYMSTAFQEKHPEISKAIMSAATWAGSLWHILNSIEEVRAKLRRKNLGCVVALIREGERLPLPQGARALHKESFLKDLMTMDLLASGCV